MVSVGWPCIEVRDVDVGFWPYSVGLLVKLCSFLSSLHWPSTVSDLGVGGVHERWDWREVGLGEVGSQVASVQSSQFQCRLFLRDRALIFGDPAGFWVRCFGL